MGAPELPNDPGEDLSTSDVHHAPIPTDDSDNDSLLDAAYDGYQPLAMEDSHTDYGFIRANDNEDENNGYSSMEVVNNIESEVEPGIREEQNIPQIVAADVEIEREVWSQPRPEQLQIELDGSKTQQAAYVYEKPREHVVLNQNTVAENFEQFLSNYATNAEDNTDEQQTAVNNNKLKLTACSNKCFCGTPNVNRIVGGTQVRQNKYPWTAQLVKGRHYPRLFCGGSLINDRYVLTAAHCVHNNRDQITIRLLQLDRSSRDPGITRQVSRVIVHPQYDPVRITNDVALLKLDTPVPFTDKIRPVCLPNKNHNFDNKDAIVAGWGLIKEGGVTSNYLQEVTVPIITNQQCRNTRYKNKIFDVMLCAGLVKQGGKDACQGDSGGPLIVNEGRFKLAGVVSFGFGCAQPDAPGVYARVSKFLDWIYNNSRDACYCSG